MRWIQGSVEEEKFGDVCSCPESEGSWYFYCKLVEREGRSQTWVCRVGWKREGRKSSQQVALQEWTGHSQPASSSTQPPLLLLCPVLASSLPFIQKRDVDSSPTKWGLHVPPSFSSFTLLHPPPFPGNFSADWVSYVKKTAHHIRDLDLTELVPSTQSDFFLTCPNMQRCCHFLLFTKDRQPKRLQRQPARRWRSLFGMLGSMKLPT